MVNVDLLMKVIKDSGMKIDAVCEKSGIERRTFWNRTTGGKSYLFNVRDIEGLAKTLNMDCRTVRRIFFATKCESDSHKKEGK